MRSIPATFVPVGFVPRPNQHFISPSLQTFTSAPHSFREILISIPQATFIPFSHKPFPSHFQWYFFIFCDAFTPKTASYSPPPISGCSFVNISFLFFNVLAAGYFHSLLTIRGRQFVPHRHPPSLQSFHSITPASAPHCISKKHPRQTVCFYPCITPCSPMVYLLQLRRVYPKRLKSLIISPPPFSCRSSVRQ